MENSDATKSFRLTVFLRQHREAAAVTLLLLLVFTVYLPSLRFPFLESWDDAELTAQWQHLRFTAGNLLYWWRTPLVGVYMPLTMFSYLLDHLCWGLNPFGYRLQSLGWHLVMTFMVFRCLRAGGIGLLWAWPAAAVFALHPQRLESVAWIAERKDVMCGAFYFWSLYCYLTATDNSGNGRRRAWWLLVLALLCKPMAASLPLVFLLVDFSRDPGRKTGDCVRRLWPFFAAAAAATAAAGWAQHGERSLARPEWQQLLTVLHNYCWYTVNFFFPTELNPFYSQVVFDGATALKTSAFYLAVGLAILVLLYRRGHDFCHYRALPVLAAYLAALAPTIGFVRLGNIDHADRYGYIPSAFLLFMAAWLLQTVAVSRPRRVAAFAVMTAWLLFLLTLTCSYLPAWKSYGDLLEWSVGSPHPNQMALVELGLAERWRGNYDKVNALADRLDRAATGEDRRDPRSGRFYARLLRAEAAYAQKQYGAAETILTQIYPSQAPATFYTPGLEVMIYQRLIGGRLNRDQYREAVGHIDALLRRYDTHPRDFYYYYYSGLRAGLYHRWPEAKDCFRTALRMNGATRTTAAELQQLLQRCAAVDLSDR